MDSQPDPCPHALNDHPKVPEDEKKKCCSPKLLKFKGISDSVKDKCVAQKLLKGEKRAETEGEEQEEDYDELLREYKNLTSNKYLNYPWFQ